MSRMNVDTLLEDLAPLDEGQGPAQLIGEAQADALVLGAMRRSGIVTAERYAVVRRPSKMVWMRRGVLLGAGVVAITTAAAAALVGSTGRASLGRWLTTPLPEHRVSFGGRPVVPAVRSERSAIESRSSSSAAPVAAPSPVQAVSPSQPSAAPSAVRNHGYVSSPAAERVATRSMPVSNATLAAAPAVDLLAQANQYRKQRQYGRALRAYSDVAERYPNTRQAEAARLAAADLRLEHLSDAKGAAEQYRVLASGRGQLGEEAAYGLVEAHRAAGRHDLERLELQRFLTRYPASPLAATARSRLAQLSAHGQ
jgi:hypothetical protein